MPRSLKPKRPQDATVLRLMKLAISEAKRSKPEDASIHPMVGAVIVDENMEIIAKAHRGERGKGDHAEFIAIGKARDAGFTNFNTATIFATLEPCTHRGHGKTPCAERIVKAGFKSVYIGALDPNPKIVGHGETYLRDKIQNVERFPSDLEREIRKLNRAFWSLFASDHLPSNSLYIQIRVSDVVLQQLRQNGVTIKSLPTESEYTLHDLAALIHGKGLFKDGDEELHRFLEAARADAFDQKYSQYTYADDARRIGERWKKEIGGVLKRFNIYDLDRRRVLDVGFGNGLEGVGLLENCETFIAADVAPESLRIAQAKFPRARMLCTPAERLDGIQDESQDIYLALRTYQSAFFDAKAAIRQAYRVLAPGGIAIISIANAYLEGNSFIKGLLPHGSKFVDRDRAHELVQDIRYLLNKFGFEEVGVHSGKAEEYVFGQKRWGGA
jgi:pyrimidine deaminase RibD-like protein/ubiquinone/menaquinone biosynthesis C-methylase UbiE